MNKIRTIGVIKSVIGHNEDQGSVSYIVDVKLNKKVIKAQSIYYSSKSRTLPIGKEIKVDYWESEGIKNKLYRDLAMKVVERDRNYLCEIIGEDIIACKDDMGGELKILLGFAILVVVVIIFFIIKGL